MPICSGIWAVLSEPVSAKIRVGGPGFDTKIVTVEFEVWMWLELRKAALLEFYNLCGGGFISIIILFCIDSLLLALAGVLTAQGISGETTTIGCQCFWRNWTAPPLIAGDRNFLDWTCKDGIHSLWLKDVLLTSRLQPPENVWQHIACRRAAHSEVGCHGWMLSWKVKNRKHLSN